MKTNIIKYIILSVFFTSCGKEFLEIKSDLSIGSPNKVSDYLAMMQATSLIANSTGTLAIAGADEYYLEDATWQSLPIGSVIERNAYFWADDVYENKEVGDWNNAYNKIQVANMVLDGLDRLKPSSEELENWNNASGSALFFRAFNFFQLAQLFCKPYDEASAKHDLGIPLRLSSDITEPVKRSTLESTYKQIIDDLRIAEERLTTDNRVRINPSKQAVFGLLAKVYLVMGDYRLSGEYAERTLSIQEDLLDFNTLQTNVTYPFKNDYGVGNPEIIFHCYVPALGVLSRTRMYLDPELLDLYHEDDLRLKVYYSIGSINNIIFRGSLTGGLSIFSGISTSEIKLIQAEVFARNNEIERATKIMNELGILRFPTSEYIPLVGLAKDELLKYILDERRRELAFRGLRWSDLRRLNKDPLYAKSIVRTLNGRVYTLLPNDKKYVWQIPDKVLEISKIVPNER
ncbi:RagB/SusD family nutrient uptake outer membrane protein [Sphingobacterium olei]|uniref:RagB/SusD family nutrient uptake outer membrane protein n=1 Tax=Sphingobacterium olei TaxID=2571155 RepID=A0A4U0P6D4_9SPHI|nr:RagB/SusD family nutrient uptake outer membrane protein [Sphingobacterium olei]TJZ63011.1 RagB/SusD family nutrient uptake outer membrane protein [Sphingobacterium olei]